MPNHVYCYLSSDSEILKEIAEVGLPQFLLPMPKELVNTTSPTRIISELEKKNGKAGITKEESQELIKKYGQDNWYDWALENWGTKWGAYDNEMDGDTYRFTTAWSPISMNILQLLSKIVPNFTFEWEEEQGFGASFVCENGEINQILSWDIPPFQHIEDEIYFLKEGYSNSTGDYDAGYYYSYDLNEYLGESLEDARLACKNY
jgi:hypothetical protein